MKPRPANGRVRRGLAPRCSVVIRAYNEEAHIARLLLGILHQKMRQVEIILVDSGSTDATLAIAARYPVRLVRLAPQDFTFGRSLNLGCAAAHGDVIVMASAHVYPMYNDWLDQLLRPFADDRVAVVYGKQRGGAASHFSEQRLFRQWFPETSTGDQSSPFCNNANAAIRRRLWRRRPYDEDLPALEDVEWATWARGAGHRVAYQAGAEVVHLHDETPSAVFNRYRREGMALKRIRPQEHFGLTDLARLVVSHVALDLRAALRQGEFRRSWSDVLWFRWMQFWGTYRGFATAGPLTGQLKRAFYYPSRHAAPTPAVPARRQPLNYALLARQEPAAGAARKAPIRRAGVRR